MARQVRRLEQEADPLTPEELEVFKELLTEKKQRILEENARGNPMAETGDKLPDEVDLATAEYEAAFAYRLRDREKYLLKKIDKALKRLAEGEYDECESCGAIISKRRLEARPEATRCIVCKEEQEQREKGFLKKREIREEEFNF